MAGAFNGLHKTADRLCFVYPEQMKDRGATFDSPAANEVYVSTAIRMLFEISATPFSRDRMIQVIDAIAERAPRNIIEFAIALDKITGLDFGRRWLREYFFVDSVSGANIRSEFQVFERDSKQPTFCTDVSNAKLYWTPL